MLKGGIPIGKAFGISLRLHYSWFFIFALITGVLAAIYYPDTYPSWSLSMKIGAGLVTSFLFFGSVLLHELCHSLVAIREGIQIQSITLFFLGGVSQMTGEPKTAADEFRMAGAGPASSLVLGAIFLGIYFGLRGSSSLPYQFGAAVSFYLGFINILLGIFNLIPGFPLDGGRVFRSLIWWRNGNLKNATRIASNVGRVIGFLFIIGGIFLAFTGNFFNGIWLALIGWFLESAAAGSYRQLLLQDILKSHMATDIMNRECIPVSPDTTVEKLVNDNIMASSRRCFPVASGNHIEGLVTLDNVRKVPRDLWGTTMVKTAMVSLDHLKSVKPSDDLYTVLQMITESDINQVPVVYNNEIVGMISRENLVNFINTQTAAR
jgi:Zn-dependent protease/predicted transcriptional regulator